MNNICLLHVVIHVNEFYKPLRLVFRKISRRPVWFCLLSDCVYLFSVDSFGNPGLLTPSSVAVVLVMEVIT